MYILYMLKKSIHENIIAEDPVKSRAFFNIFTRALFGLHALYEAFYEDSSTNVYHHV